MITATVLTSTGSCYKCFDQSWFMLCLQKN